MIPRAVALVRDIVAKAVAGNGMEQRKWTAVLKRVMAPSIKLSAAQIHSFIRLFVLLCPICGSLARPRPAPAPLSEREFSNDPKQSYRFIYLFSVVRGLSFFRSSIPLLDRTSIVSGPPRGKTISDRNHKSTRLRCRVLSSPRDTTTNAMHNFVDSPPQRILSIYSTYRL